MTLVNRGFDGKVSEADFSRMLAILGAEGVDGSASWAVTQGTGRQVSVAASAGYAAAAGVVSKDDTGPILAALSTPASGQWFLVVRRIDWASDAVTVVVIPHTTTTTTIPTLPPTTYPSMSATPGTQYDQPLAWAWARSSDTTVAIFDLRKQPLKTRLATIEAALVSNVADLDALVLLDPAAYESRIVNVDELNAGFQAQDGVWVQNTQAVVASASARDTAYAKGSAAFKVQAATCRATDTGIVWQYFGLYNNSTNPAGAKAAGWYPAPGGIMPGGLQVRSATAQALTSTAYTFLPAAFYSELLAGASRQQGLSTPFATNSGYTVDVAGVYDVSFFGNFLGGSGVLLLIKKNDFSASATGTILQSGVTTISSNAAITVSGRVALAAGDILRAVVYCAGASSINANPTDALFSLRYVEPIRA